MEPIIDFIVDGKRFATRNWGSIPRVGDIVIWKGGEVWVEVTKVIWSDDSAMPASIDRPWVQISCKLIDDPTKS